MNTPRIDPKDPAVQERIRRSTHEYVAGDGVHGQYVSRPYKREEYPKMMENPTQPVRREFKDELEFNAAVKEWERVTAASIVHTKAEEQAWLASHKKDTKAVSAS